MRNAVIDNMGVSTGGRNITDLRYAHVTALLGHDLTSMKIFLHRVGTEGKKVGLLPNAKKTKVMHINKHEKKVKCLVLSKKTLIHVGKMLEPELQGQSKKP